MFCVILMGTEWLWKVAECSEVFSDVLRRSHGFSAVLKGS